MNSNNRRKSPVTDENSSSASASLHSDVTENENAQSKRDGIGDDEKKINLNEFLDFLKTSFHVNDMITGGGMNNNNSAGVASGGAAPARQKGRTSAGLSSKVNAEVDLEQLAANELVNEILGLNKKRNTKSKLEDENNTSSDCATERGAGSRRRTSISSMFAGYPKRPLKKADTNTSKSLSGLHPKLNENLNNVLNEGVLDSVLPFICPIPLPTTYTGRSKAKVKTVPAQTQLCAESSTAASHEPDNVTKEAGECDVAVESDVNLVKPPVKQNQRRRRSHFNIKPDVKREPEVIIHVCDEVKNTTRDFTCPQSLLVSKMGYFADVTAGQQLDDMDISVHCDIHIFDWLMRWMKRSTSTEYAAAASLDTSEPQLDANNVVPILVSANFLQMEPLLVDCLSFCHSHLNEVVRTSTNMSCLNDAIVSRLAAMFTNLELEAVRDKKERVTPRLWTKLIQSLFEPEPEVLRGHYYSLSGLFRCSKCGKVLTNTIKQYISCLPSQMRLNRWGQLVSYHVRDSSFDINAFIVHLYKDLKTWRKVYWKLWGHCHFLYCCICETHFPVYQIAWCRYHPDGPNYLGPASEGCIAGPNGRYPCCGQKAFRFETLSGPNGCHFREHSVLAENDRERAILAITQLLIETYAISEFPPVKLQEVVANAQAEPRWSGLPLTPQRRQGLLPSLNSDESTARMTPRRTHRGSRYAGTTTESDTSDSNEDAVTAKSYCRGGAGFTEYSSSSDGCESDCASPKISRHKKGKKRHIDNPGRYWCGDISARSNQDYQREFEEKVMKQVVLIVNKKINTAESSLSQPTMPAGGSYYRLEADWRDQLKHRSNAASYSTSCNTSNTILPKTKK